ncbi:CaiB/BaiF CoA transferase family protein [Paraburkholderia sp. GAS32]|uniref:CaiB/BaiF CoA transferase family protein n=1 Tax=Paraburkholderia sp. GAS32 TaxID=3035129 RepID=UPI003D24D507
MGINSTLPFSGLRVLDLSQGIAGPYCAEILWQQGAEVIKIDPPEGDWSRNIGVVRGRQSATSVSYNAGKKGICLDARKEAGRRILRELAIQADVVIQNFRPGVVERLGIGFETLTAERPELVYVSISGYGQDGPYSDAPASDSVIQADSGLMFSNQDADRNPRRVGLLLADISTGLYAAQSTAAALYGRLKSGVGSHVRISLFEACAALQSNDIATHSIAGERPAGAVSAPNGVFATADGVLSVLALNNDQFTRLCRALNLPHWLEDPRFKSNADRLINRDVLHAELTTLLAQATTAIWTERLKAEDVLHAEVRDYVSLTAHPQAEHLGLFKTVRQPGVGDVQFVGVPGVDNPRAMTAAPDIGQHSVEILQAAGLPDDEINLLLETGVVRQAEIPSEIV